MVCEERGVWGVVPVSAGTRLWKCVCFGLNGFHVFIFDKQDVG